MLHLLLVCMLIVLTTLSNSAFAAEPSITTLTTAQGKYLVVEWFDLQEPFELTEDGKFAVTIDFERNIQVLSVSDGKPIGASMNPRIPNSQQWKVRGQELIIPGEEAWKIYSLPDLKALRSVPFPPALPTGDRSCMPMVYGWLSQGLFVDDDLTTVRGTLRGPFGKLWFHQSPNLHFYSIGNARTALPVQPKFEGDRLILEGYDVLPIAGSSRSQFRCGSDWFTAAGPVQMAQGANRGKGVYVKFIDHHFGDLKFGKPLHWWGDIPMVIDKDTDLSKLKCTLLPSRIAVDAQVQLQPSAQPVTANSSEAPPHNLIAKLEQARLADVDAIFEEYMSLAVPEFELIAGRKPTQIPMAFLISFGNPDATEQVVWIEMTKAEIVKRFGQKMYDNETQAQEQLLAKQREDAAARHRNASESISQENSKLRLAPDTFRSNFRTYAGYVAMVSSLFVVAAINFYFLSRMAMNYVAPDAPAPSAGSSTIGPGPIASNTLTGMAPDTEEPPPIVADPNRFPLS